MLKKLTALPLSPPLCVEYNFLVNEKTFFRHCTAMPSSPHRPLLSLLVVSSFHVLLSQFWHYLSLSLSQERKFLACMGKIFHSSLSFLSATCFPLFSLPLFASCLACVCGRKLFLRTWQKSLSTAVLPSLRHSSPLHAFHSLSLSLSLSTGAPLHSTSLFSRAHLSLSTCISLSSLWCLIPLKPLAPSKIANASLSFSISPKFSISTLHVCHEFDVANK